MDDTLPNRPQNPNEPPEEESPEEVKRPNRLDRLMGAKDRADKEAERWKQIEEIGLPLPSRDHPEQQQMTQPVIPETPRKTGDTPAGQGTPPGGVPPVRPEAPSVPPSAQQTPPGQPTPPAVPAGPGAPLKASQRRPPPSFPHPTDGPPPPPSYGQGGAASPPPSQPRDLMQEPPLPPQGSMPVESAGIKPPPAPPHQRYQPPPDDLDSVRLDSSGMPLPKRVPLEDADATLVGQSAYRDDVILPPAEPTEPRGFQRPDLPYLEETQPSRSVRGRQAQPSPPPAYQPPAYQQPVPAYPKAPPRSKGVTRPRRKGFSWGCLVRTILLTIVGGLVALMLAGGGAAIYYARVTAPSFEGISRIEDLQSRALQFETTRIRDREGNVLYQINDPTGGFRDYVTLDEVSPWVIVATVATEERNFFVNPGFSIPAIMRAVVRNYQEGEVVSGASTITQQLTRALLLPEEERTERSYQRKIKEIFLAAELGRRFSKTEILELYLNQIYYGNLAYGIEAAAQTYFGKSARDLTLAEASFLAGLPQSPAIWDPVNNREGVLQRQQQVLALMLEAGCIDTGNSGLVLPCVTQAELQAAQPELQQIAQREFHAPDIQARYPHWVVYVQQLLEADPTIGPAIYTSGFDVYTTLDPRLQDLAQQQVEITLSGLADRNVNNASVVIINPRTGAILAMVGSRNFNDDSIDGQVNIALTPQQPGSSIKPFTYIAAFRQGWTPATVLWDVPISYEIPGFGTYEPVNYDERFHGPVSVRSALANSYNVPAVQTLDHVGVPALLQVLNDVGISSLGDPSNPNGYGLSLTLGAGDVYLLEWANAFATLADGGVWHPTYAIERIERDGQLVQSYQVPEGRQAVDPTHAYLIASILSDHEARAPAFGVNSILNTPYPAAAKTGTTNDYRDNWTMGFTTELAVGVWVGNTDNSPMLNVSGVTGAGPIWRGIMDGAQQWYPAQPFPRPPGIFEQTICVDDGAIPSQYCLEHSQTRVEIFSMNQQPPPADQGLYRQLRVDAFTGLLANEYCPNFAEDRFFVVLPNPSQLIDLREFEKNWLLNTAEGQAWATQRGIPLDRFEDPPTQACGPDTPAPQIAITFPPPGSTQSGILTVFGTADAPNFSHYSVDFGLSEDPIGWGVLQGDTYQAVHDGALGQIDLSPFQSGPMTIRLNVYDNAGHSASVRVTIMVSNPTATPAPTETPPPTALPTPTVPAPTVAPPAVTATP